MSSKGKVGIPLGSKEGNQRSSREELGNSGLFLSCGGKLGVPLKLTAILGNLWSCIKGVREPLELQFSGLGPHLALRGQSRVFFLNCIRNFGVPLKLQRGPQRTSRVAIVESGILSSCKGHL